MASATWNSHKLHHNLWSCHLQSMFHCSLMHQNGTGEPQYNRPTWNSQLISIRFPKVVYSLRMFSWWTSWSSTTSKMSHTQLTKLKKNAQNSLYTENRHYFLKTFSVCCSKRETLVALAVARFVRRTMLAFFIGANHFWPTSMRLGRQYLLHLGINHL